MKKLADISKFESLGQSDSMSDMAVFNGLFVENGFIGRTLDKLSDKFGDRRKQKEQEQSKQPQPKKPDDFEIDGLEDQRLQQSYAEAFRPYKAVYEMINVLRRRDSMNCGYAARGLVGELNGDTQRWGSFTSADLDGDFNKEIKHARSRAQDFYKFVCKMSREFGKEWVSGFKEYAAKHANGTNIPGSKIDLKKHPK